MEAANNAKHVVSISLGSSKRDAGAILELGGRKISIERRGTDGDFDRARQLLEQWDGKAVPSVWVVRIYMFNAAKSVIPSVNRLI